MSDAPEPVEPADHELPEALQDGDVLQTTGGPEMIVSRTQARNSLDQRLYGVKYRPYVTPAGWRMPGIASDRFFSREDFAQMGARLLRSGEVEAKPGSLLEDMGLDL